MEQMNDWTKMATDTLMGILSDIASALPNIFGAIVVLVFGWIIIKVVRFVLKKVFKVAKLDAVSEKINDAKLFGESKIKVDISKILLAFVKWILTMVFIIVAADIMKLAVISQEIANLLRYLPILLSAMVIFMIGLFAAKLIKKALLGVFESMGFSGGKLVSSIVFYIITIFVTITSLNQAGIDTSLITNNFSLIIGAFLLAFALGFGLGSKDVVTNLLKTFYARKTYATGDKIKTKDIEGTIEKIDTIFITIKTENGKVILPISEVVDTRVEVS
ncbi:mechanosensitive ion channel [Aurantibacter crassamenti]|uniref:mechanosensitive ion channel family protein n=1 Tax=Aurantibacter crassamenti TaxID=1837375 RepID=UPI00193A0518|nr:mechanosensitive ion channel domain-containing protein [Aurantibacter crassamenti]MBM1104614.1 mechanosensitive ion channel [Aurantibacter crassamenti]